MSNAISTYKVYLMKGSTAGTSSPTYTQLVEIKDFPDLGSDPALLDKTTLSDSMRTYISGLQDSGALVFTANYNTTDYSTLAALAGANNQYQVCFGSTSGSDGAFSFDGYLSVYVAGGGVNEVVDMKITIVPSSAITAIMPS